MEDLIFTPVVLVVGIALHAFVLRVHDDKERQLLTYGFGAHVLASFAQIVIYRYYYEYGDLIAYYLYGVPIADAMRGDFGAVFPETVKIFLHGESQLPFELMGSGSTGTMSMFAVWLLFLLGNSLYASSLTIAIASYGSKILIYRSLRDEFPFEHRRKVLAATMLVPTAVFWTSTLLKEPVMMIFIGPLFIAVHWILKGRRFVLAGALLVVSGLLVALLKAYVLLSFAAAAGLWIIWSRVIQQRGAIAVKPIYLAIGIVAGIGGFVAADRFLPQSSTGGLVQSMAYQRRAAGEVAGGSDFSLEDPGLDRNAEASLASQLALVPLALITALFRPFLFEVRNPMQLLNALETTWLLYMFVQVLRQNRLSQIVSRVTASPGLMFCLAFSLVLALGTGLSTSNMGTLSRYRAPMMPFYVVLLVFLSRQPPKLGLLDGGKPANRGEPVSRSPAIQPPAAPAPAPAHTRSERV